MEDYIGKYVKHFESGNKGSSAFGNSGNDWGLSCGSYQLTLRWGNAISFLKAYFPQSARNLYYNGPDTASHKWPGKDYCSSPEEVKEIWQYCLSSVGENTFFQYEHSYMEKVYYIPIKQKVFAKGMDLDNTSRAFQECFWSWAINRGINGAYNEFCEAIENKEISQIPHEELFDLIYAKRYEKHTYNRFKKGISNSECEILRPFIQTSGINVGQIISPSVLTIITINNNLATGGKNMKYSDEKNIIPYVCMMTNSTCYKQTREFTPLGVLWHSTGANNPWIKRYVQPSKDDPNYNYLMNLIGDNKWNNSWNEITHYAGLNAWIGKLANGEVASVQTLPWTYRPWGCGSGKNGSGNDAWLQFEICEDDLSDPEYFTQVYEEAIQLTAYLCKKFNIDPNGHIYVGPDNELCPKIICHADAYQYGIGSNHADVLHWFKKYNKTMDDVRRDVSNLLKGGNIQVPNIPEEQPEIQIPVISRPQPIYSNVEFSKNMNQYLIDLAKFDPQNYSEAAFDWAIKSGLIQGDENGNLMARKFMSREEVITVLYRFYNKFLAGG